MYLMCIALWLQDLHKLTYLLTVLQVCVMYAEVKSNDILSSLSTLLHHQHTPPVKQTDIISISSRISISLLCGQWCPSKTE